jgi:hypothetical protein
MKSLEFLSLYKRESKHHQNPRVLWLLNRMIEKFKHEEVGRFNLKIISSASFVMFFVWEITLIFL